MWVGLRQADQRVGRTKSRPLVDKSTKLVSGGCFLSQKVILNSRSVSLDQSLMQTGLSRALALFATKQPQPEQYE